MTPQRRDPIDPAVADLLGNYDRKQTERSQPVAERKRKAKERQRAAARNRVMLDLPQEVTDRLTMAANRLQVPTSQVAAALLARGLNEISTGRLDLSGYLRASKSPRYAQVLDISEILNDFDQGTPL